jgi:hypothetical protein
MLGVIILVIILIVIFVFIAESTKPEPLKLKNYSPKKVRVVCSLTTRPVQPKYFDKVLDRLVDQFDAVYLALPKVSADGVPYPDLSHPGVTVVPIEEDYGPITKFFGVLNSNEAPTTVVVVLDDDIIYNKEFRQIYEKAHIKYPRCVLSGAGIVHKYLWMSHVPWYLTMTGRKEYHPPSFPSFLGSKNLTTVTGYTGICFKLGLINRLELLRFISYWNTHRECFLNDDLVFSAFLSSKNIPRIGIKVPKCVIEPDKDTPNLSSIENVGTWGPWPALWPMQRKVVNLLRDCFRNDPVRFDCISVLDIIMIIILIVLIRKF